MTNTNLVSVFNGQLNNQTALLCNARDLHQFLQVQSEFRNWITNRIADYGFTENEDYIIVAERTNGRPRKEYHITLDMGKELAMVERNEKGRMVRKYFINCERQAQGQARLENKTTTDDRTGLRNAVNMLVSKKGLIYSDAYNLVHQYMNVDTIEDIDKADLPKAVAYVHKLVLEGELIDKPTALLPEPKADVVEIPRKVAQALVKFHRLTIRNSEKAEKGLRAIHEAMGYERYQRNDLAAGLFDLHHEFNYWIDEFERATTQPQTPQLRYINA
ncbi:antA/AntB antirepressor family protein [Pasteurellaceae bacterium 20609_3]|uniref:antA/AntB antirepressor family protein n=1 Tax=Spirabiliibacterium mucosae TaxID=28156 RepID=UPI001F35F683|nr:antA/AntB antirepressor family protein [Spirabiliibacterium mucosae]MBE2898113.1 antA/AntB antirepressor family protein [Spirabiliibacterium mucosae]